MQDPTRGEIYTEIQADDPFFLSKIEKNWNFWINNLLKFWIKILS